MAPPFEIVVRHVSHPRGPDTVVKCADLTKAGILESAGQIRLLHRNMFAVIQAMLALNSSKDMKPCYRAISIG